MTSQDRASSGARSPSSGPRNIDAVLETINEFWSPRTFAVVNDYDVRLVKVRREFTRHSHPDTDEFFLVLSGSLTIKLDGAEVVLAPSDTYVVPRGTYHQPIAPTETAILLFEPRETVNTADLAQAFSGVYRRVMAGSLGARRSSAVSAIYGYVMLGAQAAEGMREAGPFTTSEQWRFGWERIYTRDEWLDQVPTQGDHRQFPPAMLEEMLAGIDAAINEVGAASRCGRSRFRIQRRRFRYTAVVVSAARTRG